MTEQIKARGNTLCSEVHKLVNSIWNMRELLQKWRKSIIVPVYEKGCKIVCSNYRGILLLPTMYKILSTITLSRLILYIRQNYWGHKHGFQHNR
jgi:hypothetical protein